jgi:hypothetical protein
MAHRKITEGTVKLKNATEDKAQDKLPNDKKTAPPSSELNVELLEFPKVHIEAADTPIGSEGNLLLKSMPYSHYKKDDVLLYNNRKTKSKMTLKVLQMDGVTKYKIKRLA